MPRPRLPVGTWGKIRTQPHGDQWKAFAQYRDADGRTRQYSKVGSSPTSASNKLRKALAEKSGQLRPGQAAITGNTRLADLAEHYFTQLAERVTRDEVSPNTVRLYRGHWDNHGAPALGGLTIIEADVQRVDAFLIEVRRRSTVHVVRPIRAVLSGMFGIAARYKVIPTNPVRDVSPIRGGSGKPVRALEPPEVPVLLGKLAALAKMPGEHVWSQNRQYTPTRIHPDIPDLVIWMLGTSQRIGQALALHWPWIDFDAATARLGPNVIRVKGEGLRLNQGTSKTKEQVLDLPAQVMTMLLVRQQRVDYNPLGLVFPGDPTHGGFKDPHNTLGDLRRALNAAGFEWVTSHTFRRTVATVLDDAGLSAREVADQLTHARPSMTQDRYMARKARNPRAKSAIEAMLTAEPARKVVPLAERR